jgi:MFS superfamily sulfate permease-like transporter
MPADLGVRGRGTRAARRAISMEEPSAQNPPVATGAGTGSPWRADILSGFLVFLIALPLCLGISTASGFPALAGIITAIVGGVLVTFLGGAPMTIKGPAAGLIVIALGAVTDLGDGVEGSLVGYRRALAVVVVAGVLQTVLGLLKAGKLGDFFPSSVVHGMLAAIGILIIGKQLHFAFGVAPTAREPLALIAELPHSMMNFNPEVLLISALALFILFGWPLIRSPWVRKIPAPLVVILIGIPLAHVFDFQHEHHFTFLGSEYTDAPRLLVTINGSLLSAVTFPDWSHLLDGASLRYIVMFTLVGSIESLLSAKAIESLDPQRRASDLNRDLVGVGIGNTLAGLLGGLPMIAEIVRSSANLNNGAKTKYANFFHGLFILVFVVTVPWLLHMIPVAALAAMLVYTGTRLASPAEFARTWKVGREQLLIFVITIVVTVATDLLVGVAAGIVCKLIVHLINGAPFGSLFRAKVDIEVDKQTARLVVHGSAVFSNYLGLKARIDAQTTQFVAVDLSDCRVVDHTVMEKLHETAKVFAAQKRHLVIRGLDGHRGLSEHPMAARKSVAPSAITS